MNDAEKAKALVRALGYPSQRTLIEMINAGSIINCPVTARDVTRAFAIFGPDLGALRGKTKKKRVPSAPIEYLPLEVAADQVLHVDVMFVAGSAFLISVSSPLNLTMVNSLGRGRGARTLPTVEKALFEQLNLYQSRRFKVISVKTDQEGSILSLAPKLHQRSITVNPVGAGSHVPVVERKIQEVKERCRAIVNTLPFRLALSLIPFLVMLCPLGLL